MRVSANSLLWLVLWLFIFKVSSVQESGNFNKVGPHPIFEEWFNDDNRRISCILCDIDGTFIDSNHMVHDQTVSIIKSLIKEGVRFFPATGRTRSSAASVTKDALHRIFEIPIEQVPGVYAQGLTVYGENGEVIFERFIDVDVIRYAEEFCDQHDLTLIAYAGDQIYCRKRSIETDRINDYCEPFPLEYPMGLTNLQLVDAKVNKLIILAEEEKLLCLRPCLEALFHGEATLTTAVPSMLEILPLGASKGDGVMKLLQYYGLQPEETIAFGDGENDIEMMQCVAYSVAMENARQALKDICKAVTLSNDDDGVGHVLRIFLRSITEKRTHQTPINSESV